MKQEVKVTDEAGNVQQCAVMRGCFMEGKSASLGLALLYATGNEGKLYVMDADFVKALLKDINELNAFLDHVTARNGALHVSFDVDVLDPRLAPGVGTPVTGGLGFVDLLSVMRVLRQSDLVTSLDIVELNPLFDTTGGTAELVAGLVASLFCSRSNSNSRFNEAKPTQESFHGLADNQTH